MKKGYYCACQPPYGYNLSIIGAFIILIDLNLQIILIISKKKSHSQINKKGQKIFHFPFSVIFLIESIYGIILSLGKGMIIYDKSLKS